MNFNDIREWWDCLSAESRYYIIIGTVGVLSIVAGFVGTKPPGEQRLRVKIENGG